MTLANTDQRRHTPWFAKAGAACSIVPISRFVGQNMFALKGGGYGCLFSLAGIDEEGLTDLELDSRMRSIEGALRGLPEGSCLYQYARVMSGFHLPRQAKYENPATEVFATDRLSFLEKSAGFRRIDLHWCLTLEPSELKVFERKPNEHRLDTSRMLADLEKTAVILESHLGNFLGLRLLDKRESFQFFSYLFNLEEWSEQDQLRSDTGVDRQIVKSPVAWHSDHLQVGKRRVQIFSLKTTPEASRPCLFSGLFSLDCDSVLCSSWRVKSVSAARNEIDAQEKFISFFKVGMLTRVMSGRDTSSLETGAGAKAANSNVDDLSEVIRRAFVAYLASHNRPVHEVLFPTLRDISQDYERTFKGMTTEVVPLSQLLAAREELLRQLQHRLNDKERRFLLSLVQNRPEWDLMGFPHLPLMPGIRWKLQNLSQLEKANPEKFAQQAETLQTKLG